MKIIKKFWFGTISQPTYIQMVCLNFLILPLMVISNNALCQTILNSSNTKGTYYSAVSITLSDGFSASGTNGAFSAIIDQSYTPIGGSAALNFVSTWIPKIPVSTTSVLKTFENNNNNVNISTEISDGLGRAIQNIEKSETVNNTDLIQPYEYDAMGRQVKSYLSYAQSSTISGSYRSNAITTEQPAFYNSGSSINPQSSYAYGNVLLDNSPLDLTKEVGSPGNSWQLSNSGVANCGHTKKYDYQTNNSIPLSDVNNTRLVVYYGASIASNGNRTLTVNNNGYYNSADLFVKVIQDQNCTASDGRAGIREIYTDNEGHTILSRTYLKDKSKNLIILSTYFVYDDFGKLAFVLPPGASPDVLTDSNGVAITSITLNSFCYQYNYDEKLRLIAKKIPGRNWDYLVYNKLNQVVAHQDGNQASRNEWSVTKYDGWGRKIITGVWNNNNTTITRDALQTNLNKETVFFESRTTIGNGYTSVAWPQNLTSFYDINYYDDYNIPNLPSGYGYQAYSGNSAGYSNQTIGLLTASVTWSLSNTALSLWNVNYYDIKNRVIQIQTSNELAGTDIYNNEYNFNGDITKSVRQHTTTGVSLSIVNQYNYDHHGRLLQHFEQIGSDPQVLMAQLTYNDLGQVINKKLHQKSGNTKFIQSIDYRYNIRGWLTSINDPSLAANTSTNPDDTTTSDVDKFGITYGYDLATLPQYNGNLGTMQWKVAAPTGSTTPSPLLSYDFRYDKDNRLTEAVSSTNSVKDANFSEYLSYDKMGNILNLGRWAKLNAGRKQIDSLIYYYSGNQATRIDDISNNNVYGFNEVVNGVVSKQANEYAYDLNGNIIKDLNKGITTITYNNFNLPVTVTWSNGNTLSYEYNGNGDKLKKVYTVGTNVYTTNYISGIQYEQGQIAFLNTDEGIARKSTSGSNFIYQYALKDKLGNTRVIIVPVTATQETTAEVYQISHYYPFGAEYLSDDAANLYSYLSGAKDNYLYNGKEFQIGINEYDYGARLYDPYTARWSVTDALADEPGQISKSPFEYGWNNPVLNTDPDGNCPICIVVAVGAVIGGTANLVSHWHEGITWGEGLSAFGVGAVAGGVTAFTGGSAAAAFGAAAGAVAAIGNAAAIGAFSSMVGNIVEQTGNGLLLGDSFSFGQFVSSASWGGLTAGIGAGIQQIDFTPKAIPDPSAIEPIESNPTKPSFPESTLKSGDVEGGNLLGTANKSLINMQDARWSQNDFRSTFSSKEATPELFRLQRVDKIAIGLKNGTILPSQVPITVVVREGNTLIVNTRSSISLIKAGIPVSKWTIIDGTGVSGAERAIDLHLRISGLSAAGTQTITERGTLNIFLWRSNLK